VATQFKYKIVENLKFELHYFHIIVLTATLYSHDQ